MRLQQTIRNAISVSGVGLHSGKKTRLTLHPAPPNTGLAFHKNTNGTTETCPVNIKYLHPTDLCTALRSNSLHIQTVEHVLAALGGLEIDNAYLELIGNEIPVLDGSSAPFVSLIHEAEIVEQPTPRTYLKIVRPIMIKHGEKLLSVHPSSLQKISYTIQYDHPLIQSQTYEYDASPSEFQRAIAQARTFAFENEVEGLWSRGQGLGGSLDNTLVFSDTDLLNDSGLRFPNECIRHKVLDLIGDMTLLGLPIIGHFIADRAGHQLHAELVSAILANTDSWILLNTVEDEKETVHTPSPISTSTDSQTQPVFSSL
ncbi:MAG: UDP-3-O-acyl-N-acetylglucosamine deacetylase, partial [Nitrospirales bacterium]